MTWLDRVIDQGQAEALTEAFKVFGFDVDFRYRRGMLEMRVKHVEDEFRVVAEPLRARVMHTHRRRR